MKIAFIVLLFLFLQAVGLSFLFIGVETLKGLNLVLVVSSYVMQLIMCVGICAEYIYKLYRRNEIIE